MVLTSKSPNLLPLPHHLYHSCYAYLEAASALAREQWTQFGDVSMVAGLALFAVTLALQATTALRSGGGEVKPAQAGKKTSGGALGERLQAWQLAAPWRSGSRLWVPTLRAWLAALALVHSVGIFSFFFLLSEGACCSCCAAASSQ